MSSILLSNPFVTQTVAQPSTLTENLSGLALTPMQSTKPGGGAGTQSDNTGAGAGQGFGSNQQANADLLRARGRAEPQRPPEATSLSVVNAQVAAPRDGNLTPPGKHGENPLPEVFPFASNLPEVKMPDPLPTSPFLKPA